MEQHDGQVRYGDIIYMYNHTVLNSEGVRTVLDNLNSVKMTRPANYNSEQQFGGFIGSMGFMNPSIFYLRTPNEITNMNSPGAIVPDISNIRDCLFKQTPVLRFEFYKDYVQACKELRAIKSQRTNTYEEKQQKKQQIMELEIKVLAKKMRIKKENDHNKEILDQLEGTLITYGSEVMIQHENSGYYVTSKMECSNSDKIGYKCELSNIFSSKMVFSISPKYRSRIKGDTIQYSDFLYLKNQKNSHFINVSMDNSQGVFKDLTVITDENPLIPVKSFCDPSCSRYLVYLGREQEFSWQVFLHASVNHDKKYLKQIVSGGDLIKISHVELNANLCCDLNYDVSKAQEIFLKKKLSRSQFHVSEDVKENFSHDIYSLWQIEYIEAEMPGGNIKFQNIQHPNKTDVTNKKKFRLRHFVSGKLLSINDLDDDPECHNHIVQSSLRRGPLQSRFQDVAISPIQICDDYLFSGKTFHLTSKDNHSISASADRTFDRSYQLKHPKIEAIKKEAKYSPLEDLLLKEKRLQCILYDRFNQEDAYKIEKVQQTELQDITFVKSCLPVLYHFSKQFKQKQGSVQIDNHLLIKVQNILKQIVSFLFEFDNLEDENYDMNIDQKANPTRQRLLMEFNVFDVIFDIVHYPFYNGIYTLENLGDKLYVREVISWSYSTLKFGMKSNPKCEMYCSQWLSQLFEYSTSGGVKLGTRDTQEVMLQNNKSILLNRVNQDMITSYIDYQLKEGLDAKFAQILSKITVCNDEPISKNQTIITQIMINDPMKRNKLIMGIKEIDGQIHIKDPFNMLNEDKYQKQTDFEKLKNQTPGGVKDDEDMNHENDSDIFGGGMGFGSEPNKNFVKNYKRAYDYWISCTRLVGDICQGRNTAAIDILCKYYPFKLCVSIMSSDEYSYETRRTICYIVQRLWVDILPFRNTIYPNCIKFLNNEKAMKHSIYEELNRVETQAEYDELKSFVYGYLMNVNDKKDQSKWEHGGEFFMFIMSIVDLSEKMLELGFFYRLENFRNLFEAFIACLDMTDNLQDDQSENPTHSKDKKKQTNKCSFKRVEKRKQTGQATTSGDESNPAKTGDNSIGIGGSGNSGVTSDENEEVLPQNILLIKRKILKIFKLMMNIQNDLKSNLFFKNYKELMNKGITFISDSEEELENFSDLKKSRLKKLEKANLDDNPIHSHLTLKDEISSNRQSFYVQYQNELLSDLDNNKLPKSTLKIINTNFCKCLYDHQNSFIYRNQYQVNLLVRQMNYKDDTIKKNSVEFINMLYSESVMFGKTLKQIQVIEDNESYEIFTLIDHAIEQLCNLSEIMDEKLYTDPFFILTECSKRIRNLNNTITHNRNEDANTEELFNSIVNNNEQVSLLDDNSWLHFFQDKNFRKVEIFSQNLIRNGGGITVLRNILKKLMQYGTQINKEKVIVKDGQYNNKHGIIEKIQHNEDGEEIYSTDRLLSTLGCFILIKEKDLLRRHAVSSIFQIFSRLCMQNDENKHIQFNDRHQDRHILKYTKDFNDASIYIFFNELFHDNKKLLFDFESNKLMIRHLFDQFAQKVDFPMKQGFYLVIMKRFIFYKKFHIKPNQNYIISKIISEEFRHSLHGIFGTDRKVMKSILKYSKEKILTLESKKKTVFCLSNNLCFVMSFVELITSCCYGRNSFSEKISHTIFSFEDCLELIGNQELPSYVHLEMLKFLHYIYIITDVAYNSLLQELMGSNVMGIQIRVLKDHLNKLKETANVGKKIKVYFQSHKELILESDLYQDVIEVTIDCLKNYIKRLIMTNNVEVIRRIMGKDVIYQAYDTITQALHDIQLPSVNYRLNDLYDYMQKQIILGNQAIDQEINNCDESNQHFLSIRQSSFNYDNDPSDFEKNHIQKNLYRHNKWFKNVWKAYEMTQSSKFNLQINDFFSTSLFNKICDDELEMLRHHRYTMLPYDPKGSETKHTHPIYQTLIRKLSGFQNPENKNINDEYYKIGLKIQKLYITQKTTPSALIHASRQNFLIDNGIVNVICLLLHRTKNDQIIMESLHLACQILEGGNKKGQKMFHENMKSLRDRGQLKNIEKILRTNFNYVNKIMSQKNEFELNKRIHQDEDDNQLDSFKNAKDGHTHEDHIMNLEDFETPKQICMQIFEFFQLLCEGHNIDLQNFLRTQEQEDDENVSNSVDFIAITTNSFVTFIKFYNSDVMDLGQKILSLLVECVQGPCLENQKTLHSNKIVESCREFMNEISNYVSQLLIRGFDEKENTDLIDELLYKVIEVQLSLSEGNDYKNIINEVRCSVDFSYLRKKKYELYKNYILVENEFIKMYDIKTGVLKPEKQIWKELFEQKPKYIITNLTQEPTFDEQISIGFKIHFFQKYIEDVLGTIETDLTDVMGLDAQIRDIKRKYQKRNFIKDQAEISKDGHANNDNYFGGNNINVDTNVDPNNLGAKQIMDEKIRGHIVKVEEDFYEYNTGNVEVDFNNIIQKYYFPVHPSCRFLPSREKTLIVEKISQAQNNDKIDLLIKQRYRVIDLMNHVFQLWSKYRINYSFPTYIRLALLINGFIINLIILVESNVVFKGNYVTGKEDIILVFANHNTDTIYLAFGIFHAVLAVMLIISQNIVVTKVIIWNKSYIEFSNIYKDLLPMSDPYDEKDQVILGLLQQSPRDLSIRNLIDIYDHSDEKIHKIKYRTPRMHLFAVWMKYIFSDGSLNLYLGMTVFSIITLASQGQQLYGLFLLDIIPRFSTLQNVILALKRNATSLMLTALLCMIVIWIYTVFGYYYQQDSFWNTAFAREGISQGENQCTTMMQCFLTVLSQVFFYFHK